MANRVRQRAMPRPAFLVALALSLVIHVTVSLLPDDSATPSESTPLTATLTELPPPPTPVPVATPAPAPKPKPRTAPAGATARTPAVVLPDPVPASEPEETSVTTGTAGDSPAREAAVPLDDAASLDVGPEPPPVKTLPPRIDLAYKVFFGIRGFQIGEATYRFEHAANRYRITTVGQARGLAALFVRGQGRVESRGTITRNGLLPLEFSVDRFNRRGREAALFDWDIGIVTLPDDQTVALESPTFDPLTLMWQYYFTPPEGDQLTINLATTRRVARYTVAREGRESIPWNSGTIETERWARRSDDGKTEAYAWLAPSLRYIPVKMRVTHTTRGTLEALLDAIRVDESGETVGRDDVALEPSPPSAQSGADAPLAPHSTESSPGATFPAMTGQ
jgi:hypothetical protein